MKFSDLTENQKESVRELFAETYPDKVCDEVEVDENGALINVGYTCTKSGCNCVGGWMATTGNVPYGQTFTIKAKDVL